MYDHLHDLGLFIWGGFILLQACALFDRSSLAQIIQVSCLNLLVKNTIVYTSKRQIATTKVSDCTNLQ